MSKKVKGLLVLLCVYLIAYLAGLVCFKLLVDKLDIYLNIFICNVVATIVVWLGGVIFRTASVYDPYWSVQTVLIGIALMVYYKNFSFGTVLYLGVIWIGDIKKLKKRLDRYIN